MIYETLYTMTKERGGVTVKMSEYPERIVMPTNGFAVSALYGTWMKCAVDNTEGFDRNIEMLLSLPEYKNDYLGTWVDGNMIHIDPVKVFADKKFATGWASALEQEAIYDIFNNKTIRIRRK